MLLNFYRVLGVAACLTFGVGSARGWKVPGPGLVVPSGGSQSTGSSSGSHGFFHFGSGRSSSGSGGWGGGK